MNFTGLIVGIATFLCIGLFHPLVIKAEYYFLLGFFGNQPFSTRLRCLKSSRI
ncbi:MAG: DUF4491 family protein, partial [Bacteroidales bacterium]|nr:DUF4491 family protein [Bacteroidales bacterium]